jgi:AraC family transcriptional activator of pobA
MTNQMKKIPKISFREDLKTIGFECLNLAELTAKRKPKDHHPNRPHKIDFFAILTINEGSVKHQLDFKEYNLKKNDCLVISQGQVHSFDSNSSYNGHLILFTSDFLVNHLSPSTLFKTKNLFDYHLSSPNYHLDKFLLNDIKNLAFEYAKQEYVLQSNVVASLFSIVILKLNNRNLTTLNYANNQGFETFEKFKNLVEKEYHLTRNVSDFASKLHVSYKHLNEICKRFSSKTAKSFIDDFVILEIKRKLSSTSLSIKEISFENGFDEPTNFLKYFKKIVGQTPLEFKSKFE